MNKPEDMFDIERGDRQVERLDGSGSYTTMAYYLVYKATGQRFFPKTRKCGYSHLRQAKAARTRLFNDYKKRIEKELLGLS